MTDKTDPCRAKKTSALQARPRDSGCGWHFSCEDLVCAKQRDPWMSWSDQPAREARRWQADFRAFRPLSSCCPRSLDARAFLAGQLLGLKDQARYPPLL